MQEFEISYLLSKQIPSIDHELIIESNYGRIVIYDPQAINEIKEVIIQASAQGRLCDEIY